MKLNHIGITVSDAQEARAFLEKYFGLKGVGPSHRKLTHVQDDSGLILSLFQGSPITTRGTGHDGTTRRPHQDPRPRPRAGGPSPAHRRIDA